MDQSNYYKPSNSPYNYSTPISSEIGMGASIGIFFTIFLIVGLIVTLFILIIDRDRKLKSFIEQTNNAIQSGYKKDLQQNVAIALQNNPKP
jgi:predicted PurR-regulated permease PerM